MANFLLDELRFEVEQETKIKEQGYYDDMVFYIKRYIKQAIVNRESRIIFKYCLNSSKYYHTTVSINDIDKSVSYYVLVGDAGYKFLCNYFGEFEDNYLTVEL